MEFWRAHPEAWSAATTNPEDPEVVMSRFADWVLGFEGGRSFAARPLAFDGIWMDHYLREFAGYHLLDSAHLGKQLFSASALDLGSYMSGIFGRTKPPMDLDIPKDWLGDHPHTHRAIDDARGYAFFLSRLLRIAERQPGHRASQKIFLVSGIDGESVAIDNCDACLPMQLQHVSPLINNAIRLQATPGFIPTPLISKVR